MKRVWKYLRKVEKHLPLSKRIAVGGAIYAELRDQVKVRARETGRDLTEEEIDQITKAYGDPRSVAQRRMTCDPESRPLVDRYLAAVGRNLPQDKAHDILAEMREAIESEIEAREEQTGETMSRDELAELLKQYDPPMVAAARYAERDRLIGSDLFPFFWPTAKAVVGIVAAIAILAAAWSALTAGEWARFLPRALSGFFDNALPAFAILVIVFMLLDRSDAGKKIAERWNPRDLPEAHIREPKPLFGSVLALGFDILFILWWTQSVDFGGWAGQRDPSIVLNWDGRWADYHGVILALAGVSAAVHLSDIFHPAWSRLRSIISIAAHAVGAFVALQLARSPALLADGPGANELPERAGALLSDLNLSMQVLLGVIGVIFLIATLVEAWRLVRSFTEGGALTRINA